MVILPGGAFRHGYSARGGAFRHGYSARGMHLDLIILPWGHLGMVILPG
jgi:hypothetical protein